MCGGSAGNLWRVAALSMMRPDEISAALQGEGAAAWMEAAAHFGIAEAEVRLGRLALEQGDASAAFTFFRRAADQGDEDGHNMLGRCFEHGWGTAMDYGKAAYHYRVAAEAGLDWAQYNLGHMLLSGVGMARDRGAAFACYAQAAAKGHVRAMNLLGRCHEEGWGTERDLQGARRWYRCSAQGGYFRGAYNYADVIASEGCVIGARYWFARALSDAPEPTRGRMLQALSSRSEPSLRDLAKQFSRTDRSVCPPPAPHAPKASASGEVHRQNP